MPADPDCIFCKILAGEIPSTRVAETERAIAFMDINPGTRGHALVIPREHSPICWTSPPKTCTPARRPRQRRRGPREGAIWELTASTS